MTYRAAALYVDPRGPYPGLVVDWWDEKRDARNYAGPWPVVAHPPCGPWSSFAHFDQHAQYRELAPLAIEQVWRWGGVLEHPRNSKLWMHYDLPRPGDLPDEHGGRTIEVDQVRWGHPAKKRTWLYLIGISDAGIDPPPRSPTHRVARDRRRTVRGELKECSAQQRRRTPLAFAHFLCQLAESARQPPTNVPCPPAEQ